MNPIAVAIFDIDGVIRDVGGSYRRAISDTVEHYTNGQYRPTVEDIDRLKSEGVWNNDWKASEAMIHRYYIQQNQTVPAVSYAEIVDYFQQQYRGPNTEDPNQWTGYIASEPLLLDKAYLQALEKSGVPYAFFSGATRGSANFVLQRRVGLSDPLLVAMEDAPSKPDPTGLMKAVQLVGELRTFHKTPIVYAGDTAADMQTVAEAKIQFPKQRWLAIGVLPPHAQQNEAYKAKYAEKLRAQGAIAILENIQQLTAAFITQLL